MWIETVLQFHLDVITYIYYSIENSSNFSHANDAFKFVKLLKKLNDL